MALEPRVLVIAAVLLLALAASPAAAIVLAPGFDSAALASGLAQPTAAAFAPDGRLFILEKAGAIRLWTPGGGLLAEPLAIIPSCTESEMGLLGVAVDPGFADNGFLYLYHTHPPQGDVSQCGLGQAAGRENRVVRVTVAGDRIELATLVVLFSGIRTDNGNHDGGALRVGPDGLLYVGAGDSGLGDSGPPGAADNPYAQDLTVPNGKILRLTLDGHPAPGNPFVGRGGAADFVLAYGLRNPFRFAFDAGGVLWVGDVGQNTWEEIDVVRAGDNLGWPQCEGPAPQPACPGATVPPVYAYDHNGEGASVTGGVFYDGAQLAPVYRGNYFFGDFVLDVIWRAVPTPAHDGFRGAPAVIARRAGGPVDFLVAPDGALCYVAFSADEVRCITPARGGAVDGCTLALGDATPGWLRRTAHRVDTCARREDASHCVPPPGVPRTPRRRARALGRACGSPPPAALCERLGCAPCGTATELVACAASEAAAAGTALGTAALGDSAGRCARAVVRQGFGFAAQRVAGITACVRGGGASCGPGDGDVTRLVRRLARACRRPPAALCAALACAPCDAAAFAGCVAAAARLGIDEYARRLFGGDVGL